LMKSNMANTKTKTHVEIVIDASIETTTTTPSCEGYPITIIIKEFLLPVLARFHAGYFRISLSLCSQALLWKILGEPVEDAHALRLLFRMLPTTAFVLLWSLALLTLASLSFLYILRCLFHFQMVKAEFLHHVGVNYLFAPWISWLLLLQSSPFISPKTLHYLVLWWVFVVPMVVLDVKIYGQWFTKGKRFLSTVANPTSQLTVIGNLVGARAAAEMGWRESAVCMFSLGMAHYLVLFVTLYQRLSGGNSLPAMLRPVFFLFIAAPSVASLAWDSISGRFDTSAKMLFFLSVFLFLALVCRPCLFRKSMKKFNVAWWAYSFPLTVLALASIDYAQEVKGLFAHGVMMILSSLSVLVSLALLVFTAINTKMLLPDNDPAFRHSIMDHKNTRSPVEIVIEASHETTTPVYGDSLSKVIKRYFFLVLARFHAGYFRISLSLCSQALLWKILGEPAEDANALRRLLGKLPTTAFVLLWSMALLTLASLSILYILRCLFRFQMVKAEFLDHVGVNYLFAPWISWLLLLQSSPFITPKNVHYLVLWWVFVFPMVVLDVKIYGQWFTKGKRFLSTVANPTSQLSVIGNLVGAWSAAEMGWRESAMCMFSLGMAHYLVLFVTLYQRLSGGNSLPAMLRPVFFLFFAAPSVASLAWDSISGRFDNSAKMLFFLSLFLFLSLVCRPALFRKSMRKFNVAWWAYSYPLTVLALASVDYAQEVKGFLANGVMIVLSSLSVLVSLLLLVFTAANTKMLLPDSDPVFRQH
ncbi:hypothetical protein Tsubulata_038334, partial [Turnera subulata]